MFPNWFVVLLALLAHLYRNELHASLWYIAELLNILLGTRACCLESVGLLCGTLA